MAKTLSDLRVLIIDDNPINHRVVSYPLKDIFGSFKSAYNGEEGLEVYKNEGADIILMDIAMPILNGINCTKAIRDYEAKNNISTVIILAMTGSCENAEIESYIKSGMNGYIEKPVNKNILISKIEQLINR